MDEQRATRRQRGFNLIELLVVITVIAILMGLLLPAMAGARNASRLAVSQSNMKQISLSNELYRVEKRDALPVPFVFVNDSPTQGRGSINMYGGNFCSPAWTDSGYDYWPAERMLNPYTNPDVRLPHPRDEQPSWTLSLPRPPLPAGMRESVLMNNCRSPGDKRAWEFGPTTPDFTISQYDCSGSSYMPNIYWVEIASYAYTNNMFSSVGWNKAIRWGTRNYNRIDSSKFVVAGDMTMGKVFSATPMAGAWPQIPGEFGGNYKSVMGFADGHAGYIEMKRLPTGTFPFSQNAAGSLSYPGFEYSLQMDMPPPR